jgi:hypothetical protein
MKESKDENKAINWGPPWKEARREAVGPVEDSNQLGDRLAEGRGSESIQSALL